jgi:hypothetical protein
MKFRSIVYPSPESSYMPNNEGLEFGQILYIPKEENKDKEEMLQKYIPCLLIRYEGRFGGSSKVLI